MSHRTAAKESIRGPSVSWWVDGTLTRTVLGVVAEAGREPPLGLGEGPAPALGVVGDLVGAEPSDHEVLRLRVAEIDPGDRGSRPHRHRVGELHARLRLDVEKVPQGALLGVV